MLYTLNNDCVYVDYSGTPYIPANLSGHPDTWCPAEGGEIEIEEVEYRTKGKAFVDGKWITTDVRVDVQSLLSDDQLEDIQEQVARVESTEEDYYE